MALTNAKHPRRWRMFLRRKCPSDQLCNICLHDRDMRGRLEEHYW